MVLSVSPPPGALTNLTQIIVTFSEPVTPPAPSDLLIGGIPRAASVAGAGALYTFTLGEQPPYGVVEISWDAAHAIFDLEAQPNRFDETLSSAQWQYNFVDVVPPGVAGLTPAAGIGVRQLTQIEVLFTEPVVGIEAGDLLVNGLAATGVSVQGAGNYVFTFSQPASGPVQLAWAANHGIRDFAGAPNSFPGGSWTYTLDPNLGLPSIRINEFLAANSSGLTDEDTNTQDWVEIWNYGTTPVDLAGYALTDDVNDPDRWVFPSTNLGPGQFLVVFASGEDRKVPANSTRRLHTNFKLNPDGEYLGLFNPESPRSVITEFAPAFPEQRNDYSYGYDEAGDLRYFETPTPGAANGTSAISGIVPPPHFNVPRGLFDASFTLILSTPLSGATIRYTTDGSEPTLSSSNAATYAGPLTINKTTVIRAAAFKTGAVPSITVTHSYLFLDQVVQQPNNPAGFPSNWGPNTGFPGGVVPADYEMDMDPLRVDPNNTNSPIDAVKLQRLKDGLRELPVVSIVMKTEDIFGTQGLYQRSAVETGTPNTKPENKKPCSVEMVLPDGTTAFTTTCGIDLHGNASRNPVKNPKHGFKLNFRGDFGPATLQYRVFEDSPVEEFDDLLLRPDFNSSWRHWSDTAGQSLGAFQRTRATRTRDAWMKDAMRDIGGLASHNRFCHLYLNGLYWGTFEFSEEPTQVFAKNALGGTEADFDIYDQGSLKNGTATAYNAMVALPTATTLAQYDQYRQYLNLPEFIDYMLLHFFMGHQDWSTSITKNWYAIRKRVSGLEGTFRYIPWDGECILLNEDVNRVTVSTPPSGLHTKLSGNAQYRLDFADRIHRHMVAPNGMLMPPANIARWQKWQAILDKPIVAESVRWGDYRRDVHRSSEGVYQLYTRENHWLAENIRMLGYFSNRTAIVLGQLRAANLYPTVSAPSFNQQGGLVARGFHLTMTATNGIYYTIDGTDPRVYGTGAVSPNATTYSGGVLLTNSVVIKARALFNGTIWSALNETTFHVDALSVPLRITEIMYNPTGGDAYEFLELQNIGGVPLNLSGYSFDGITFSFPLNTILAPGQTIVLGSSAVPGNWNTRYPGVTAFGRFDGRLDNTGEKIAILDASGNIVWSVDYDDADGWPTAPDGQGYSLEIIDVFGDPDDPANWQASAALNGTPATVTPPPPLGAVTLNEIMADNRGSVTNGNTYPDWIELRNAGAQVANIAGWSVTDSGNPRKYIFPPNTTIPAGGYLVVWADTNNAAPGLHTGFALDRDGETISLFNASTARVDSVTFGLQVGDFSVGRIGGAWNLNAPTPSLANLAAALAPSSDLAINEWLADAPPGGSDWIEVQNRSASAPAALRGIHLGNGNTIHQIASLSFVAPGGFVQLFADELAGADRLDFKLSKEGGPIILYDAAGVEIDRVAYALQVQNVTQGRLPDGDGVVTSFPASASPAASNYLLNYGGPFLNEVLAINDTAVTNGLGRQPDFIELRNTNATAFDLSGYRLSNDANEPAQWVFPPGSVIAGHGYLVVWFDNERGASTLWEQVLNTGGSLDGENGGVWLFNPDLQPVDSVEYGFQVADQPIGRLNGGWTLLTSATPGANNAAPSALASAAGLRINEWMAEPLTGSDWFELYNSADQPVSLPGLFVADTPSIAGLTQSELGPLSFIGANGFVKIIADGDRRQGLNHANFSIDLDGEALSLSDPANGIIDAVYFGLQTPGVSEGRLPDGGEGVASFRGSASPAESNYLPLRNAVINEVLAHANLPLEDAIEIYNPTDTAVNLGGWYLSDSQANFKKFRIPDETMLPAYSFKVFYENQINGGIGSLTPFTFDSVRGEGAYLSQAGNGGDLTGYRSVVRFEASANGVSFGRQETTLGPDFAARTERTFGADAAGNVSEFRTGQGKTNAGPKVGPIVINEIMYHPPNTAGTPQGGDNTQDEYIELYNMSSAPVQLYRQDTAAAWRLRGGVSFDFPEGFTLDAHRFLLIVSFDPTTNAAALTSFRGKYGLPGSGGAILGPYDSQLVNSGERVELLMPDTPQGAGPDAGFVPYILVDAVNYDNQPPWAVWSRW